MTREEAHRKTLQLHSIEICDTLKHLTGGEFATITTAREAMLELRVKWENLQGSLRNKRVDGYPFVIEAMEKLAALAIHCAAALQAQVVAALEEDETSESPEEDLPMDFKAEIASRRNRTSGRASGARQSSRRKRKT